ncbi:MAG: tetratricopeptide repeat protein [Bacteroidota bacterium]
MEILKKQIIAISFLMMGLTSYAQADNLALRKAFKESYTFEYSKLYAEAIAALAKVHDENSYELQLRLGWLNYMNKNYTQSQAFYSKAVSLKPYAVEAKLGLVKPLSALESWDKVLQLYEEVIKIDPQNYTANYWAGAIYYTRKKYEPASRLFEKIVNLYPFDYDGNHMLAWTYLNMGKNNEAKAFFNKALLNRPDDSSSLDGISKLK